MSRKVIRIKPGRWSRPRRRALRIRRLAYASLAVIAGAGILLCVGAAVGKMAKPYVVGHREGKEIAEIKRQIAEAESENRELKAAIEYLSTPAGVEVEARKLGWVKKGEIAVVVERPRSEQSTVGPVEDADRVSFWRRVGRGIARLFGGRKAEKGSR